MIIYFMIFFLIFVNTDKRYSCIICILGTVVFLHQIKSLFNCYKKIELRKIRIDIGKFIYEITYSIWRNFFYALDMIYGIN